jgi:hypothetical protein
VQFVSGTYQPTRHTGLTLTAVTTYDRLKEQLRYPLMGPDIEHSHHGFDARSIGSHGRKGGSRPKVARFTLSKSPFADSENGG